MIHTFLAGIGITILLVIGMFIIPLIIALIIAYIKRKDSEFIDDMIKPIFIISFILYWIVIGILLIVMNI